MGRKVVTTRLNIELMKALKHLAVDTDKAINDLLEEAIADLLQKYKEESDE